MRHGRTRLRSCGDGCVRRCCIFIVSVMAGRHFRRRCLPSWNSSKAVHRICYVTSDYYRFKLLIFIQFVLQFMSLTRENGTFRRTKCLSRTDVTINISGVRVIAPRPKGRGNLCFTDNSVPEGSSYIVSTEAH